MSFEDFLVKMKIDKTKVRFKKYEMNVDIKNKITVPWALCERYTHYNAYEIRQVFSSNTFGNNVYFFNFDDGVDYNKHANCYTRVPDIYVD